MIGQGKIQERALRVNVAGRAAAEPDATGMERCVRRDGRPDQQCPISFSRALIAATPSTIAMCISAKS